MSETIPRHMSPNVTGKWHELAEKRRAHFIELYESGRWKHYYSEHEFITRMRETVKLADDWSRLAESPLAAE